MITDVRNDLIAALKNLLGAAIPVIDSTVREITREKLKQQTCIVGPDNTTKARVSRTHVDERYEFVIAIANPLSNDPQGKVAQETADSLGRQLLKQKQLAGNAGATVLSYAPETLADDEQYRGAGQITSGLRVTCGVYA